MKVEQANPSSPIMASGSNNTCEFSNIGAPFSRQFSDREATSILKKHRPSPGSSSSPPSSSSSHHRMGNHPGDRASPPSPILPPELIENILSRLPVKVLLQLRCVCKSWLSLISDPKFAKLHLRLSTADRQFTHHHVVFCFPGLRCTVKSCPVASIRDRLPTDAVKLKYPLKKRNRYDFIVGSCNGLLCFAIRPSHILIWNPSIRKCKKYPSLDYQRRDGSYIIYGFGYDQSIDNYKVVAIFCYDSDGRGDYKTEVKVYTLGADSWRRIQEFPSGIPCDEMGKFVSGTLNWVAISHSRSPLVVISLDLGKESYVELSQPDHEDGMLTLTLGILGDCLSILYYYGTRSDVWIMKDFGVKESWTKLFSIPFVEIPIPLCPNERCISESSEILFQDRRSLYWYNSKNSSLVRPEVRNIDGCIDAQIYVESLTSPCF
ncbi:F-box/kelch-repeat protein At3g23880-like [Prosopis cineraria]|uniref:F-box/kelch-repeat protein At3g23880-like n=1 Tax=Prosopis cineraria TaxID=364024 RepID=UPI00240ED710|nr:F-box/kelch-repeat protein At3g23880-like [Prosopis cineraria]